MTTAHTQFKAIFIFDAQLMKQHKASITAMLPFTQRRLLDRISSEHHRNLLTCINTTNDARNWSQFKCYIMEFNDADIAQQHVVQATLASVGLIRTIRYDEGVFNQEIAAFAEFVMHASSISSSSRDTMQLIRKHTPQVLWQLTTREPHFLCVKSAIEINENCIEIIGKIDENLQHLAVDISRTLNDLEIK